jgi:hypothetical protein
MLTPLVRSVLAQAAIYSRRFTQSALVRTAIPLFLPFKAIVRREKRLRYSENFSKVLACLVSISIVI